MGKHGEILAAKYLRRHSYKILDTNWKSKRGEIDIVALKDNTLVFVEVKSRSEVVALIYDPIEAVDGKKQNKLNELAQDFMKHKQKKLKQYKIGMVRFDVLGVYFRSWKNARIKHIEDAFGYD